MTTTVDTVLDAAAVHATAITKTQATAMKAFMVSFQAVEKAYGKVAESARILVTEYGYNANTYDHKKTTALLKGLSELVKTQLEVIHGAFSAGDGSIGAKAHKVRYDSLKNACIVGYERDKPVSNRVTGNAKGNTVTRKANATANTDTVDTNTVDTDTVDTVTVVEKLSERAPLKLSQEARDNLAIVYDVSGTPAQIWEKLEMEFLDLIASSPELQSDIAFRLGLGK